MDSGSPPGSPASCERQRPCQVYTGAWTHADPSAGYTAGDLFGTESFTNVTGAKAEFSFTGTQVGFYSAKAENLGIVAISVDGGPATEADLYAPAEQFQQRVFERTGLTGGEHTVTVRVTGRKNAASVDAYLSLDAIEALGGDPFAMDAAAVGLIVSARVNHPDLAWGNYVDPAISLSAGWTGPARVRLLG
ncbi:hypothetical protein OG361_34530 [Streptomyces sp. NBC_00090]|uniref:hypothetical protein n=1 Tax=Streptomyces sp. NBC_00090 TaxID=2903619 RepID=UPI003245E16F